MVRLRRKRVEVRGVARGSFAGPHDTDFNTAVHRAAFFGGVVADRPGWAIARGDKARRRDAALDESGAHRFGAAAAEVFIDRGAAGIVRVPLDAQRSGAVRRCARGEVEQGGLGTGYLVAARIELDARSVEEPGKFFFACLDEFFREYLDLTD